MRSWVLGANSELPRDVSVSWALPVPAHFHARYLRRGAHLPLPHREPPRAAGAAATRAAWVHRPLDHERMGEAARALVGEHDFSAFRAAECQAHSPVRRMERLSVERRGDWVVIEATANAFLHHMMRNIAGLLIAIGKGEGAARLGARGARGARPHAQRGHRPGLRPVPGLGALPGRLRAAGAARPRKPPAPIGYDRAFAHPRARIRRCPGSRKSCPRASRPSGARARCRRGCGSSARRAMRCCTAPSSSAISMCAPSAATTCAWARASGWSASSIRTPARRSARASRPRTR